MPETRCDTQTLQALIEEAYALTYRGLSLKVTRRYRKLIRRLEQRSPQGQVIAHATCDGTDDGVKAACRARSQSA